MANIMKELKEIEREISEHPGKIAYTEWENIKRVYGGIYLPNRKELVHTMLEPSHNADLAVELFQNVRPPTIRNRYINHLIRLLHNYVASSATLVDHSRRLISRYEGSKFQNEYAKRKQKIADAEEHRLITDLRNYIVHHGIPPLAWVVNIPDQNSKPSCDFNLDVEKLLRWDKWSPQSKKALLNSKPTLDLIKLVNNHGKIVDGFNSWLLSQFTKLHGKDIEAVNKLIKERNRFLGGK